MARPIGGFAAIFDDEHKTVAAAAKCRDLGFKKFDAITPFPVHGMEEAIGIKRSMIPWATFFGGLTGLAVGLLFTIWTSAYDWPINVGGKPMISLPAFIPICFELTILFAALGSVSAFAWMCGLPKVDPPTIDPTLTSHRFAIFVPTNEAGYDEGKLETLFRDAGAVETKKVAEF